MNLTSVEKWDLQFIESVFIVKEPKINYYQPCLPIALIFVSDITLRALKLERNKIWVWNLAFHKWIRFYYVLMLIPLKLGFLWKDSQNSTLCNYVCLSSKS
jgi:hypothetical protein